MISSCFRLLLILVSVSAIQDTTSVFAQSSSDPILRLNGAFREAYADARKATLAKSGPIILAGGDGLILIRDAQRIEGTVVSMQYHDLKTIAHVPVAVYSWLAPVHDGIIDERRGEKLRELLDRIEEVRNVIGTRIGNRRLAKHQRKMLRESTAFIQDILKRERCTREELQTFVRKVAPIIQSNLAASVKLRIDNYHSQMLAWRKSLSEAEWSALHVVVPGAATPRKDNLTVQYFAKLLGERGEGSRIVYAESLFAESEALKRLGTHMLDTEIGVDFFGDPWRMHRDLTGVAAANYLDGLDF